MEEVTSNMTIAAMMMYLACHEVEWKCTNIKSYPIFCAYPIFFAILGLFPRFPTHIILHHSSLLTLPVITKDPFTVTKDPFTVL